MGKPSMILVFSHDTLLKVVIVLIIIMFNLVFIGFYWIHNFNCHLLEKFTLIEQSNAETQVLISKIISEQVKQSMQLKSSAELPLEISQENLFHDFVIKMNGLLTPETIKYLVIFSCLLVVSYSGYSAISFCKSTSVYQWCAWCDSCFHKAIPSISQKPGSLSSLITQYLKFNSIVPDNSSIPEAIIPDVQTIVENIVPNVQTNVVENIILNLEANVAQAIVEPVILTGAEKAALTLAETTFFLS